MIYITFCSFSVTRQFSVLEPATCLPQRRRVDTDTRNIKNKGATLTNADMIVVALINLQSAVDGR